MQYLDLILIFIALGMACLIFLKSNLRTSKDVLSDLADEEIRTEKIEVNGVELTDKELGYKRELQQMGLSDKADIKNFELKVKLIPIGFILAGLLVRSFANGTTINSLILCILFSFGFGVIFTGSLKRKYKENYNYRINFFLPLIMERLVMAVQAGQDVLPAIGIILGIDRKKKRKDPVSELFVKVQNLSEAGLSFERSLNQVAESVENSAVRHAFIHLGMAHKEGGEIIAPLRELSDSTQLFYQETIEEEIAKMPVKATMPLLLTFAGLIICFLTSPLIQILDVMQKSMPK